MQIISKAVPTHIVTGFLGAGKTTLLKQWLLNKPENEVWAVLMNEFGEIGLDQLWIEEQGIAVKEVLGGCLCCTSQLPMQIALGRLLSEYKPDRLIIEPTGLGHPQDLLKQLTQPHWQTSLSMRKVINVVDGSRLHEKLWEQHDVFTQQLDVAEHVVISHAESMNDRDIEQLNQLKQVYSFPIKDWYCVEKGQIEFNLFDQSYAIPHIQKQVLLTQQIKQPEIILEQNEPKTLPYHYTNTQGNYTVAGWHLPKSWIFDADQLIHELQQLKGWERIKAKLRTDQSWLDINAIPSCFDIDFAAKSALDQKIEIITTISQDWLSIEKSLMEARIQDS